MNAEVFGNIKYFGGVKQADLKRRVCELEVGQTFLMGGVWRIVHSKKDGRLHYYYLSQRTKRRFDSLGANSQMFVQIAKIK